MSKIGGGSYENKRMSKINVGQALMAIHLKELGLSFTEQAPVHPGRRWRFDFLLHDSHVAIEVDGYFKGKHGAGWGSDNEKSNVATMMGYRLLRFGTGEVKSGAAKQFLFDWIAEVRK